MEMKKIWKVSIVADGIKKKCRKSDRHIFDFAELPDTGEPFKLTEELKNLAKVTCMENMRTASKVKVTATPLETDGHLIRAQLFNPRRFEQVIGV
jgi:hypothetical protein